MSVGKNRSIRVHIAVLLAFRGLAPRGMECRHVNGDRTDNRLENLEWGTRRENADDKHRHGTDARGVRHGKAKLDDEKVRDIRRSKLSTRALGRLYGVEHATIRQVRNRITWTHVQ